MNGVMQWIQAPTLSILITFTLHHSLNEKTARGSLFERIIVDDKYRNQAFLSCFSIHRNITSNNIPVYNEDLLFQTVQLGSMFILIVIACCYGVKASHYIALGLLTISNVWFLARLFDDIHLPYQVDVLTIYFLCWQLIYPIYQWCTHQLSWPALIVHQGSMCFLSAIIALISKEIFLDHNPSMSIAVFWFIAFYDVYACFHHRGRLRIKSDKLRAELFKPNCSTFPPFCFYSHDIEDQIDVTENFQMIGGGDFLQYNGLLLWLLPPSASLETQLYILLGFIICIKIAIHLTIWIEAYLEVFGMPGVPIPVIIISAYAIFIDVLIQNSDEDCLKIID